MSAKARDEVVCFCGAKILLKNLKLHNERNHNSCKARYSLVQSASQTTLSFGQPPQKIQKPNPDTADSDIKNKDVSIPSSSFDLQEESEDVDLNIDLSSFNSDELENHKVSTLISGASSFEEIKYYASKIFNVNDDNHLYCRFCKHVFEYVPDKNTSDRRNFRNLKIRLKRHIKSKAHFDQFHKEKELKLKQEKSLLEAKQSALSCAKAAYLVYKQDMPYDSYPFLVQFAHESGGKVGTKNHSRKFAINYLPHVTEVIRKTIFKYVEDQPFGLTADKITCLGLVRYIFGTRISQLREENDLCAIDIYLSHSIVSDVTALDLAVLSVLALKK